MNDVGSMSELGMKSELIQYGSICECQLIQRWLDEG